MGIFQKYKNLITILVVVGMLALVYFWFSGKGEDDTSSSIVQNAGALEIPPDRKIVILVRKAEGISLDRSIFESGMLGSLVDFSQQIIPQSVGKQDPFSPF